MVGRRFCAWECVLGGDEINRGGGLTVRAQGVPAGLQIRVDVGR